MRQELVLGRDSRFRRRVETHDVNSGTTTLASAGRYRVEGHRLVLQTDDGARISHRLLQPDPSSNNVLLIDGEAYLRRAPDLDTAD